MNKITSFNVIAVANGYILNIGAHRGDIVSIKDEYVFETFEALVKFLDENIEKPEKTMVNKTDAKILTREVARAVGGLL